MTQDEIDLIYEYLHKNYEYKDGELLHTSKRPGVRIGMPLGGPVFYKSKNRSSFKASLRINGKLKSRAISTWIYIYHYKKHPDFIKHIDGNPANNNIENLKNYDPLNKKKYRCTFIGMNKNKFYVGDVNTKSERDLICLTGKKLLKDGVLDLKSLKIKLKEIFPQIRNRPESYSRTKGVEKNNGVNRWQARITFNGKRKSLGTYNSIEEAKNAYLKAKKELSGK